MNLFFHLSVGVAEILSAGLSDEYYSFLWTNFSYLLVEELFLVKPRNFICHVQVKTTCEPGHISKICRQNLILQI